MLVVAVKVVLEVVEVTLIISVGCSLVSVMKVVVLGIVAVMVNVSCGALKHAHSLNIQSLVSSAGVAKPFTRTLFQWTFPGRG